MLDSILNQIKTLPCIEFEELFNNYVSTIQDINIETELHRVSSSYSDYLSRIVDSNEDLIKLL